MLAGLAGAIGSVPDGMATALLAGANPVAGLYSSAMGPLFGGMVTSTGIMVIATTSAAALGTAEALDGIPADEIDSALGPSSSSSASSPCWPACSSWAATPGSCPTR